MGGCASCHYGHSARVSPPPVAFGDHKVSNNTGTIGAATTTTHTTPHHGPMTTGRPTPTSPGSGGAGTNAHASPGGTTDDGAAGTRGRGMSLHARGGSDDDVPGSGSSSHLVHAATRDKDGGIHGHGHHPGHGGSLGGSTLGFSAPQSAFTTPSISPLPDPNRLHIHAQPGGGNTNRLSTPPDSRRQLLPSFEDTPETRFEFFKRTVFAARLTSEELRSFADLFKLERHSPDTTIFRQGQYSETFFIIWQGQVDIQVDKSRPLSAGIKRGMSRTLFVLLHQN
jgi:hypothetical protein